MPNELQRKQKRVLRVNNTKRYVLAIREKFQKLKEQSKTCEACLWERALGSLPFCQLHLEALLWELHLLAKEDQVSFVKASLKLKDMLEELALVLLDKRFIYVERDENKFKRWEESWRKVYEHK